MKVGVIGSGDVGKSLAAGFAKHGHEPMIGTRDPGKLAKWLEENGRVAVGTPAEAAGHGDILVLAVKGTVALDALRALPAQTLAGKLVLDATNPIAPAAPVNGVLRYFTTHDESLMESLQKAFPAAHFVKAFSCVGHLHMVNPQFAGGKPTMFICGNSAPAKKVAASVLDQFGWDVEDMGAVEAARAIEPLAMLWCIPGLTQNKWGHAFKLLK